YVVLAAIAALLYTRLPRGFLPEEDQGQVFVQVLLPPGATQEQTRAVLMRVNEYFATQETEAVDSVLTVVGFGFIGQGQNSGFAFVKLKDWDERTEERLHAGAIAARATRALSQ